MDITIYADVLFFVNFLGDFLLLFITNQIIHRYKKMKTIALAAIFGGLYSTVMFITYLPLPVSLPLHFLALIILVKLGVKSNSKLEYLKGLIIYLTLSCVAGALISMLYYYTVLSSFVVLSNGVIYYNISAFFILIALSLISLAIFLSSKISVSRTKGGVLEVQISIDGKTISAKGLMDTGNEVFEPLSNLPVIFAEQKLFEEILPGEIKSLLDKKSDECAPYYKRVRLVPYDGIWNQTSIIPAIKPDYIRVALEHKTKKITDVYIAIADKKLSITDDYSLILNKAMI